jgi:hypothetical protein
MEFYEIALWALFAIFIGMPMLFGVWAYAGRFYAWMVIPGKAGWANYLDEISGALLTGGLGLIALNSLAKLGLLPVEAAAALAQNLPTYYAIPMLIASVIIHRMSYNWEHGV